MANTLLDLGQAILHLLKSIGQICQTIVEVPRNRIGTRIDKLTIFLKASLCGL
jgi:hypothetical protein